MALLLVLAGVVATAAAQSAPPAAPPTPRAAAPIDLTGVWVSIVNEDWRWRMVTPPKGDYPGINLTPGGRAAAEAWDPGTDGSCKAYGAPALLRMPTRLRISWAGDAVLLIESDAGEQTRRLQFASTGPIGPSTLQGHSLASWERSRPPANAFGFPGPPVPGPGGALKAVTTNLLPGWLRRNGVPYSERTVLTEYFDRFPGPDGSEWFVVTSIVEDPVNLLGPFTTSSHFRREPDGSKWSPTPCRRD